MPRKNRGRRNQMSPEADLPETEPHSHGEKKKDLENKQQCKCSELEELNRISSTLQQTVDNISADNLTSKEELLLALSKIQELEEQLCQSNEIFKNESADKDSQLSQLQEIINNLNVEKIEVMIQLQNQSGKIEQLELINTDLERKLEVELLKIHDLTLVSSSLQEQVGDLFTKNTTLEKELTKKQEDFAHASSDLQQQVYDLSTKNSTLQEELDRIQSAENQQLNCEIGKKDAELAEFRKTIQSFEKEKKECQILLEYQGDEIKQLETSKKDLERQLQLKFTECEELVQSATTSHRQADELSALVTVLEEKLSLSSTKTHDLETQLSELCERYKHESEKDSQLSRLQKIVNNLEVEKEDIMTQLHDQNGKLEELEIIKTGLERKIHDVTVVSADLQERVGNLLRENSTLDKELAKTQEDLAHVSSDLQQQVCDLSAKNSTLQEELDHTKNTEKHLLELNQQLKCDIRKKDAELVELQNTIQIFEKEKKESQILLENEVSSLRVDINSLETKVESKEAECVALKKEVDHANGVLMSLQEEYNVLDGKNKELTSQLSSMTADAAHLKNVIQEDNFKIDRQDKIIVQLNNTISEKNIAFEELRKEISSLKVVCKETNRVASVSKKDVADLEVQLIAKSCEVNKLKKDIEAMNLEFEKANDFIRRFELNNKETHKMIDTLKTEKCNLEKDLNELVDKMKSAEQGLCAEKATVALMTNEISSLKEKLEEANVMREKIIAEKSSLQQQLENQDSQLREAYDKLVADYHRLNSEHDEVKSQLGSVRETVRAEYEILKEIKAQMESSCTQALEAKDEQHTKDIRKLQEMSTPDSLQMTRSHDQLGLQSQSQSHSRSHMLEEETVGVSQRQSVRTVPSGIGKVFPSEDEAGEVFNNEGLADLKSERCQGKGSNDNTKLLPDTIQKGSNDNTKLLPDKIQKGSNNNTKLLPDTIQKGSNDNTKLLPDTIQKGSNDNTKLLPDTIQKGSNDNTKLLPDTIQKDRSQVMEVESVASSLRKVSDENRKPGTPSRFFSNIFSGRQRKNKTKTPDRRRPGFFGISINK